MNTQKALTILVILGVLSIATIVGAQFLPSDTRYSFIFGAFLACIAGAIKPVSRLLAGGEERQTTLKVRR